MGSRSKRKTQSPDDSRRRSLEWSIGRSRPRGARLRGMRSVSVNWLVTPADCGQNSLTSSGTIMPLDLQIMASDLGVFNYEATENHHLLILAILCFPTGQMRNENLVRSYGCRSLSRLKVRIQKTEFIDDVDHRAFIHAIDE